MSDAPPTVLTVAEAAELLRFTERKVQELARTGDLPGVKFGREWRFNRRAIERLLEDTP